MFLGDSKLSFDQQRQSREEVERLTAPSAVNVLNLPRGILKTPHIYLKVCHFPVQSPGVRRQWRPPSRGQMSLSSDYCRSERLLFAGMRLNLRNVTSAGCKGALQCQKVSVQVFKVPCRFHLKRPRPYGARQSQSFVHNCSMNRRTASFMDLNRIFAVITIPLFDASSKKAVSRIENYKSQLQRFFSICGPPVLCY